MGERSHGIDPQRLADYASEIKNVVAQGVEVAIVIGGGNIFRGVAGASNGMDRVQGDYMGMLATIINGLALQSALESAELQTRLQTALKIEAMQSHISKGVLFATWKKDVWLSLAQALEIHFYNRLCSCTSSNRGGSKRYIERNSRGWYL